MRPPMDECVHKQNKNAHLLAPVNPPLSGGIKLSTIGLGSVGCEILCLRVELVLDRGSIELMDARPTPPEFERLNHLVGLVNSCVKPLEGEAERGRLLLLLK